VALFFFKEVRPSVLLPAHLRQTFQSATSLSRPVEASEGIPFASSLDNPLPLRQLLTYPVFICIVNYACLEFLDSSHCALLPLFFAMPIEIGGLGFDPRRIGYIMGVYRAVTAVFMATYFSKLVHYLGERRTYILSMATFHMPWVLFPVMNLRARHHGISTSVWMGIVLWIIPTTSTAMAFGSFPLFLFLVRHSRTDNLISTFSMYLCIPHCADAKQAFSGSNHWPFTDDYFDSAHYSPLVVDIPLFLLYGAQSSWRLCGVRLFLVLLMFCGVGCNEITS